MRYKKVRGNHCWLLEKDDEDIATFSTDCLSDDEDNANEIIEMEEKLRLIKLTLAANEAGEIEGDATKILSEIAFEWPAEKIRGLLKCYKY